MVRQTGLPVCLTNNVTVPRRDDDPVEIDFERQQGVWVAVIIHVASCLGIPHDKALELFTDYLVSVATKGETMREGEHHAGTD